MPVLVLARTQLQAIELHVGDTYFAGQHAAPDIRHHLHFIQAQGAATFAHHHVMCQQHRRHAAPAPFEAADGQRHAQGIAGLGLHVGPVFGNQGREFSPEADVERRQHQQ